MMKIKICSLTTAVVQIFLLLSLAIGFSSCGRKVWQTDHEKKYH